MQVPSLAWEDSLEERMATHSSILARRIPWTEEPGGLQSMWSQRVGQLSTYEFLMKVLKTLFNLNCTMNKMQSFEDFSKEITFIKIFHISWSSFL